MMYLIIFGVGAYWLTQLHLIIKRLEVEQRYRQINGKLTDDFYYTVSHRTAGGYGFYHRGRLVAESEDCKSWHFIGVATIEEQLKLKEITK